MKIAHIILYQCDTPFTIPFHTPQTIRSRADSILVKLLFDNGISGYGESAPRSYVTGETPETVVHVIENRFSKILFDENIQSIDDIERVLDTLETDCLKRDTEAYHSALGAIDIALLDAWGKFKKKPPHEFLYPIRSNSLRHSIPIPIVHEDVIRKIHSHVKHISFDSIKVLLDDRLNHSIERVRFVRSLFGDHVRLRLEANGKWSREQAVTSINELKRFNISAVEQPVNRDDIEGLRYIRITTGVPVVADESMCTLSEAERLIAQEACDIINIKISKCGGLMKSRRIADFARSNNVPCMVGAHVGETAILHNAGKYFAMTLHDPFCFEGLSFLLYKDGWKDNHATHDAMDYSPGFFSEEDLPKDSVKRISTLSPR
jgi:L-alanine-DL-glutamate epimerase-like enolase superfamily enzyme